MGRKKAAITTHEFDALMEAGEELVSHLDLSTARRPSLQIQRVNVDFPVWEVDALDREANRLGITRQSLIKVWIAERLERITAG
jgi:hypothetical protein